MLEASGLLVGDQCAVTTESHMKALMLGHSRSLTRRARGSNSVPEKTAFADLQGVKLCSESMPVSEG